MVLGLLLKMIVISAFAFGSMFHKGQGPIV